MQRITELKVRYLIKLDNGLPPCARVKYRKLNNGFAPLYAELNSKGNWWAALGYPEASSPLWGF